MHFENPSGHAPYIGRWEIVDVEPDPDRPGKYVLVLADGDLYELEHNRDALSVCTMLEFDQRLELRGLA